jgi:hypothetical protein
MWSAGNVDGKNSSGMDPSNVLSDKHNVTELGDDTRLRKRFRGNVPISLFSWTCRRSVELGSDENNSSGMVPDILLLERMTERAPALAILEKSVSGMDPEMELLERSTEKVPVPVLENKVSGRDPEMWLLERMRERDPVDESVPGMVPVIMLLVTEKVVRVGVGKEAGTVPERLLDAALNVVKEGNIDHTSVQFIVPSVLLKPSVIAEDEGANTTPARR